MADSFSGFFKDSRAQRLKRLHQAGLITQDERRQLEHSASESMLTLADQLIENVIGCFPMPLGLAHHFVIDGHPRCIPMAVEETSIIAAASRTAQWINKRGTLTTQSLGRNITGQIQFPKVHDFEGFHQKIQARQAQLIQDANQRIAPNFVRRGGGITALTVRKLNRPDGKTMGVVHVIFDPCDAMGANVITQICEYLKQPLMDLTQEQAALCIVSNLSDHALIRATVTLDTEPSLGQAIEEAALFAALDPYRAATSNKGVMNGIDGLLIATGNDWRAVGAGIHAYAARHGTYQPITQWHMKQHTLTGVFEAPLVLGTVGGVTQLHPMAKLCLNIIGTDSAEMLSRIAAAVGLVQNLGALMALTQGGLVQGHMRLHLNNLIMATDAQPEERLRLQSALAQQLKHTQKITQADVHSMLSTLRKTP